MMRTGLLVLLISSMAIVANATAPYTENFATDVANWGDSGGANFLTYVPSGGPDGSSYASTSLSGFGMATDSRVTLFRGQNNFNSSNHAFEGNWTSSGIGQFSHYVRHNAPIALPFWVRFSTSSNFPGVGGDLFTLVQPNTWTKLTYNISPSEINNSLFPEGPPSFYNSVFSAVGNIQIGYTMPAGFNTDQNAYTFGLDQPSIAVPEPASWMLFVGCTVAGWMRRRSRAS